MAKRWGKEWEHMAKDMIDPTNLSQNDVQRFCFNQEWKRKKHRYGIDMIHIDDGWLVKLGREEAFCDRLQSHAVLGVYEIWLCIEA
jgi:hypothetical protein